MKLPPVAYRAVDTVDAATALLAEFGDAAAVLAGGQSLLLDLRYGVTSPALLVDVNRVPELATVVDGAELRIGALVRHAQLETRPAADPLSRLLRRVAPYLAHPPIRALGTFVGSIAWAHPAAEWCALARALDASVLLVGPEGERTVPAEAWFRSHRRTARRPDELVREVRLPSLPDRTGVGFAEHRRSSASFALAAAMAAVEVSADGRVRTARVGLANAGPVPWRAVAAEAALVGNTASAATVAAAAEAAAHECDPFPEPHCSVAYRRQVIEVLVRRALTEALDEVRSLGEEAA
jgi:carbon-monoxide dehydrogenase medium subunit